MVLNSMPPINDNPPTKFAEGGFIAGPTAARALTDEQVAKINAKLTELNSLPAAKPDLVNHPPHYINHPSGVECIQITRHMSFDLGNAMKYIWRAGNKESEDEAKDIAKAIWYLQDHLKMLQGESGRD